MGSLPQQACRDVLRGPADSESDQVVLYLGAANGTTVSHVADYTAAVYAVEYATADAGPAGSRQEEEKYRADHGRCHSTHGIFSSDGIR